MANFKIRDWKGRLAAFFLCLVMVLMALPTQAFAATGDIGTISFALTYDSSGNAMRYNSSAVINGYTAGDAGKYKYRMYVDGETAFCIQPGVPLHTGDTLKESSSATWNALSSDQKKAIGLALLYGYQGNKGNLTGNDDEKWLATQTLVWEFATGCRNATGSYKQTSSTIYQLHFGSNYANSGARAAYDQIVELLMEHNTIPSFLSESKTGITKELPYSGGKYTVTLTDNNGVLSDYTFSSSNSKVSVTKSGNKLTISSTTAIDGSVRITATRNNVPTVSQSAKMLAYGDDSLQDVVTGVENADSVTAYINIETPTGTIDLKKTSEDGKVSGIQFTITGNNYEKTVTTGSDGTISVKGLFPGIYTVTEASYDRYVPQKPQTVTVIGGQTSTVSFSNILKKFRVTVTKTDAETGGSQGDATLSGAVYGIYKSDELVDTYTTDAKGQFTTSYYICGDDWTIREVTPSEGYLLDGTVHHVGAEAKLYTVEYNSTSNDVTEQVIKGNIAIIKHSDDGSTQIETPEEGAVFGVYLKSADSYENTKETERDVLTCDENGFAQTKELPYGVYTVHQVSGWEGRELIADFDVYISKDGETCRYLINNANFTSYLKVVKTDAETGKTIPYAGAGFQIYDPDGNLVTMTYTYPSVTAIDTFYTNNEGYLITPQTLEYGTGYTLVEVEAPYGYILDSTPVAFDVIQSESTEESGITVIEVVKTNMPQKGTITVVKTGEVFSTVTEGNGVYLPAYSIEGLAGAVYEITAAEDIHTPDGTLRAFAGEVVDTITTDSGGVAVSKELYLGKYIVTELAAPDGMVLDSKPKGVEITYAGQEAEVTNVSAVFYNERQKAEITLEKVLERDEAFGVGMNGEIQSVTFGLYAAGDLTAADGTILPAGGLIEIISIDENGCGSFTADLPLGNYYVQELSADEHYLISGTQYPVTFEYAGQDTALVTITVNDKEAITNKLIRGSISGIKVDGDGEALAGAVIGLFKPGEKEFTAKTAIMTDKSGKDGGFLFKGVPYGNWIVREIEAPAGYVLSEESHPVAISEDGQVIKIEIENVLIRGSVQVIKTDTDGSRLSSAVFGLYSADGELLQKFTIPDSGEYTVENLLYGDYYLLELEAPKGYELSKEKHEFSITEHEQAVRITVENEKTPATETAPVETVPKDEGKTSGSTSIGSSPKTGDDSDPWLWLAIAGIASAGAVTLGVIQFRKKKGGK